MSIYALRIDGDFDVSWFVVEGLHSVDSVIYEAEVGATWRESRETRHEEIEEMRRLREGRMVFIESHGSVML